MGQLDNGQDKLFYSFNLDSHVPQTHLLRGIVEFMICMLIVGYCFGIRSERRLCEEVHLNLA
jgi:hypothetical protein